MARPTIYTTLEEKRAANRAKSKRSYQKNKASISIRRHRAYRSRPCATRTNPAETTNKFRTDQSLTDALALSHLEEITTMFNHLVDSSPSHFLEKLRIDYAHSVSTSSLVQNNAHAILEVQLSKFEQLRNDVYMLENRILTDQGHGATFQQLKLTVKPITRMIDLIQEMYCEGLEGST